MRVTVPEVDLVGHLEPMSLMRSVHQPMIFAAGVGTSTGGGFGGSDDLHGLDGVE